MTPLYVVVRADLPAGLQLAQACHVTREFGQRFASLDVGESLVVLHAPSESALVELAARASRDGVALAVFHEPDLGGAATAAAFDGRARKLLSCLPLALRTRAYADAS